MSARTGPYAHAIGIDAAAPAAGDAPEELLTPRGFMRALRRAEAMVAWGEDRPTPIDASGGPGGPLQSAWLYGGARGQAKPWNWCPDGEQEMPVHDDSGGPALSVCRGAGDVLGDLRRVFNALTSQQQRVLNLQHPSEGEGASYAEIAERLGVSLAAVNWHVTKAAERLRTNEMLLRIVGGGLL